MLPVAYHKDHAQARFFLSLIWITLKSAGIISELAFMLMKIESINLVKLAEDAHNELLNTSE